MSTILSHSPLNISQTVRRQRQRLVSKEPPIGNGLRGIKSSLDRGLQCTLKGQSRDLNTHRSQYLKNSCRCYLATIANYQIICCDCEPHYGQLSQRQLGCLLHALPCNNFKFSVYFTGNFSCLCVLHIIVFEYYNNKNMGPCCPKISITVSVKRLNLSPIIKILSQPECLSDRTPPPRGMAMSLHGKGTKQALNCLTSSLAAGTGFTHYSLKL